MGRKPQTGWTGIGIKLSCSFCHPMPPRAIQTNISITHWNSRSILATYLEPNAISAIKQLPSCELYNILLIRSLLSFNIIRFPIFLFGSNSNIKTFQPRDFWCFLHLLWHCRKNLTLICFWIQTFFCIYQTNFNFPLLEFRNHLWKYALSRPRQSLKNQWINKPLRAYVTKDFEILVRFAQAVCLIVAFRTFLKRF